MKLLRSRRLRLVVSNPAPKYSIGQSVVYFFDGELLPWRYVILIIKKVEGMYYYGLGEHPTDREERLKWSKLEISFPRVTAREDQLRAIEE